MTNCSIHDVAVILAISVLNLVSRVSLVLADAVLGLTVVVLEVTGRFLGAGYPGVSVSGIADAGVIFIRLVLLKPRWFNYIIRTRNRLDPSFIGLGSSFSPRRACGIKFNGCTLYFT